MTQPPNLQNPKAINAPPVVVWSLGLLLAIHLIRQFLPADLGVQFSASLAFFPLRYETLDYNFPGGPGAAVWSFLTYGLLHGDWAHLIVNGLWLLAFGTPLARLMGPLRFLGLCAITTIMGAALFLVFNDGEPVSMIGASGAVSGMMGAVAILSFQSGGGLGGVFATRRSLFSFIAVWLGINLIFGLLGAGVGENVKAVAWEAHLGGFAAGIIVAPWLVKLKVGPS